MNYNVIWLDKYNILVVVFIVWEVSVARDKLWLCCWTRQEPCNCYYYYCYQAKSVEWNGTGWMALQKWLHCSCQQIKLQRNSDCFGPNSSKYNSVFDQSFTTVLRMSFSLCLIDIIGKWISYINVIKCLKTAFDNLIGLKDKHWYNFNLWRNTTTQV